MQIRVNEKVDVVSIFNVERGIVFPRKIVWKGRDYTMTKLGYYHPRRVGRTVFHIFDVTDGTMSFRLVCSSENLHWILEEVSDGNST